MLFLKFEVQQVGHSVVADVCQRAIVHNVVIKELEQHQLSTLSDMAFVTKK